MIKYISSGSRKDWSSTPNTLARHRPVPAPIAITYSFSPFEINLVTLHYVEQGLAVFGSQQSRLI